MASARRLLHFPLPISIGTDICEVSRIGRILHGPRHRHFIRRILAEEEIAVMATGKHAAALKALDSQSAISRGRGWEAPDEVFEAKSQTIAEKAADGAIMRLASHLAGRFAAKEAVIKAHPHRQITLHDIIIRTLHEDRSATEKNIDDTQADSVREDQLVSPNAPVAIIKGFGKWADQVSQISISHDGGYATAVCLGWNSALMRDMGFSDGGGDRTDGAVPETEDRPPRRKMGDAG